MRGNSDGNGDTFSYIMDGKYIKMVLDFAGDDGKAIKLCKNWWELEKDLSFS